MPITYPLAFPTVGGPVKITWTPESAVQYVESEFTFLQTVYAWEGQRRSITVECGDMILEHAKKWQSFILKLNGPEGTFYWQDFVGRASRGTIDGLSGYTARVNGAGQNGPDLITDGWPVSVTGLMREGDWISINDRLYTLLADVSSNGSGQATLTIWPHARRFADNQIIIAGNSARGKFNLMAIPEFVWNLEDMMEGFTFTAMEALRP